jgi:hypothetical protein
VSFGADCALLATVAGYQQARGVAHAEKVVSQAAHGRAAGCQNEPLIGSYTLFKRVAGIAAPHFVKLRAEPPPHLQLIRAPDFHFDVRGVQERQHPMIHRLQVWLFFSRMAN